MKTKITEKRSLINVNIDHKFLWGILILLVIGVGYASTTISDSYINTTGQVNATEFYVNDGLGNSSKLTKPYDVVVCRTADTGCDVVCTDSDCSTEIQSAINLNGCVKLKNGLYPIGTVLNAVDNMTLEGSGQNTIIQANGGGVGAIKILNKSNVHISNIRLSNLNGGTGIGLQFIGSNYSTVENVYSDGWGADGMGAWQGSFHIKFYNNFVKNVGTNCYFAEGVTPISTYISFIDNTGENCGGDGIRITDASNIMAVGNEFFNITRCGVIVSTASDVQVNSNNAVFVFDVIIWILL